MIKDIVNLLRVRQYYKNLLIFLPLIFSGMFFDFSALSLVFIGFIALCLISSANYAINDILDAKRDRLHPEKKTRPIASGKIKAWQGILIAVILFIVALALSNYLAAMFLYAVLFLFLFTLLYSLVFKNEVFVDILSISVLLVVRAVSGALIINVWISPWLIVGVFFLALFLVVGKRSADTKFLGRKAEKTRKVLKYYTPEITNALMVVSTAILIIAYSLYSFFSEHRGLIYTIPFALYLILRYFSFVYSGNVIAREPEKALLDWKMITGIALWGAGVFGVVYFV